MYKNHNLPNTKSKLVNYMKKKIIKISLLIIGLILIYAIFLNSENNEFRIRVIANSNSESDIKIKKECFEIIKKYIKANDTKEDVKKVLPQIEEELENYSIKVNYSIKIDLGKNKFPPKTLNNKVISGGMYDSLVVTIGKGEGSNYWTLLYPEYYGITFEDIDTGNVEIKSYFWELINS